MLSAQPYDKCCKFSAAMMMAILATMMMMSKRAVGADMARHPVPKTSSCTYAVCGIMYLRCAPGPTLPCPALPLDLALPCPASAAKQNLERGCRRSFDWAAQKFIIAHPATARRALRYDKCTVRECLPSLPSTPGATPLADSSRKLGRG